MFSMVSGLIYVDNISSYIRSVVCFPVVEKVWCPVECRLANVVVYDSWSMIMNSCLSDKWHDHDEDRWRWTWILYFHSFFGNQLCGASQSSQWIGSEATNKSMWYERAQFGWKESRRSLFFHAKVCARNSYSRKIDMRRVSRPSWSSLWQTQVLSQNIRQSVHTWWCPMEMESSELFWHAKDHWSFHRISHAAQSEKYIVDELWNDIEISETYSSVNKKKHTVRSRTKSSYSDP